MNGGLQAKKPLVVIMTDGNNYTTKISETRFQATQIPAAASRAPVLPHPQRENP